MAKQRERGWPPDPEPLPVPVVDNHTHLDSIAHVLPEGTPAPTVADHLARAAAVGVDRLVQVGCDLPAARWTDALLREPASAEHGVAARPAAVTGDNPMLGPGVGKVLGAVAIHPNEAVLHGGVREVGPDGLEPDPRPHHDVPLDDAVAEIAAIARANDRVRAIGETGMDLFRTGARGEAVQREAFRAHVALAKELGLALQIHDRDAHAQVLDVLARDGAPERTVFHCYSGDAAMARFCAEQGWYLSFAGPVTFRANDELRAALRAVPLGQVLVETDAPYLTPHPYRGRPNAPYVLPTTVRTVAEVVDRPLADVCERLAATSVAVYGSW
ncbi:TatD family hydrolase [Cellulosimicrobium funkei]|uniref:TatD family deoxyribonuclease n=1 Tax=Cellulosimicrobium funkei TaxID=264251 RepID=A0A4Y8QZU1_9MICO|nr:TatD family hydrolase [Cellulosimicrobium funkei]TFF06605.1 TatD family deoxyribonuclease [Cellulosimicrobium funkei]TGA70733.1 TatD family deoxyribonuclease [Cellulosimicrobium terreum]